MSASDYYSMLVCENGHVLTECLERSAAAAAYCDKCGAKTISTCPSCGSKVRGQLINSNFVMICFTATAPKYCPECGEPYPWTLATIEALKELAALDDDLDEVDKTILIDSAKDAMTDNPKTRVAALKVKKVLGRAGKATASAARDLLVDVLAESAKKMIWP